jgi:hypothetical protein
MGSPFAEFAEEGGEVPEVATVYWIDDAGFAWRVRFTLGNEFSDPEFACRNYLISLLRSFRVVRSGRN